MDADEAGLSSTAYLLADDDGGVICAAVRAHMGVLFLLRRRSRSGCKARDATWRVVRTLGNRNRRRRRRGRRWVRRRRGPRSSAGATTVGFGERDHEGNGYLLVPSLPLSIPPEELLLSDYILFSGHPRCPRTCMRSSSSRCGTRRAKTEGRRACVAKTRHQIGQKQW